MAYMKPHLGNGSITFKQNINASSPQHKIEYQVSSWIQYNNGWDEAANKPYPMNEQQLAVVRDLHAAMAQAGVQMQVTIKQKTDGEARTWPMVGRFNMFTNKVESQPAVDSQPVYQAQQGYQPSEGNNEEW